MKICDFARGATKLKKTGFYLGFYLPEGHHFQLLMGEKNVKIKNNKGFILRYQFPLRDSAAVSQKKFSTFLVGPKVVRFKHEKYSVFFGTSGHLLNCINGI